MAEVDNNIEGRILFSYIDLVTEEETLQVLGLAPLAVLPEYQNRGIGSKLVEVGLEIAYERGDILVVVLGHPQFYPRFGFDRASSYNMNPPFPVPDEAFMVKILTGDRVSYRGKILYNASFIDV